MTSTETKQLACKRDSVNSVSRSRYHPVQNQNVAQVIIIYIWESICFVCLPVCVCVFTCMHMCPHIQMYGIENMWQTQNRNSKEGRMFQMFGMGIFKKMAFKSLSHWLNPTASYSNYLRNNEYSYFIKINRYIIYWGGGSISLWSNSQRPKRDFKICLWN